jgi:hypothetical protein
MNYKRIHDTLRRHIFNYENEKGIKADRILKKLHSKLYKEYKTKNVKEKIYYPLGIKVKAENGKWVNYYETDYQQIIN